MGYKNIQGGIFKSVLAFFVWAALFSSGHAAEITARDSIGIEERDGKTYILHEVEPKETVYGLSQRYNVPIADIIAQNPEAEQGLKIGVVLRIPYKEQKRAEPYRKITHVVEASQTLYSLSKTYDISIEDIKKWNNLPGNELNVGQELVLFTGGKGGENTKASGESKDVAKTAGTAGKLVHTVEKGQTLFSISKMYEVSVNDIKKWNNLSSNELNVGEQLTISVESDPYRYARNNEGEPTGKKEDTAALATAATDKKPDAVVKETSTRENAVRTENEEVEEVEKETKGDQKEEENKVVVKNTNSSGFKKIVELGMAEVIEQSSDTKKYVALHKTAPVGTIMQVTNEMNNQNVFVRVIGKLPDTGVNNKVLIKISRPAYERLGAVNNRFPAEISYVP